MRCFLIEITGSEYWLDHEANTIKQEVLAATVILIDTFFNTNVEIFSSPIDGIGLRAVRSIPVGHILAVGIPLRSDNAETRLSLTDGVFGTVYCSNSSRDRRASATADVAEFCNVFTGCFLGEDRVEERIPTGKLLVMLSDKTVNKGVELTWDYKWMA